MAFAGASAMFQAMPGAPEWIANVRDTFEAVGRAMHGIRYAGVGPVNGPMPSADVAAEFLAKLGALSFAFLTEHVFPGAALPATKGAFREALLDAMARLDAPIFAGPWNEARYGYVASILTAGAGFFPSLAAPDLAARLYRKLGATFPRTTTDPLERAREALLVAGLTAREARAFLEGADAQKKSRDAKREAAGKPPAKPRKRRSK